MYDLSANTSTEKVPAVAPSVRCGRAMACIGGDQVLLPGGWGNASMKTESWVYHLRSNTWKNKAPAGAPSPRSWHAMTALDGGDVLLFGGWNDVRIGDTWLASGFNADTPYLTYMPVVLRDD